MSGHAEENVADVIAAAKEKFDVIVTDGNILLIDIDNKMQMRQYEKMMDDFSELFDLEEKERWASKDGGTHIVVGCASYLEPRERIALQACLGSDPKREILGLKHIKNGVEEFSFLFRPRRAA